MSVHSRLIRLTRLALARNAGFSRPQPADSQRVFDLAAVEAELEHRMDRTFRFQRQWGQLRVQVATNIKERESALDLTEPERKRVQLLDDYLNDLTADELLVFFVEASRVAGGLANSLDETASAEEKRYFESLAGMGTPRSPESSLRASLDPKLSYQNQLLTTLMTHPAVLLDAQSKLGPTEAELSAQKAAAAKKEEKKEAVVEKSVFSIKLTGYDAASKVKIIKEVKTLLNLGLKEAKDLVDKVPSTLFKDLPKAEAEKMLETLKGFGCQVVLE